MRKYYLEIESYKDDKSISTLRIIDQATKNRAEEFIKTLKNLNVEFYRISADLHRLLCVAHDLSDASTKIITLEIKNLLESESKGEEK